MIFWEIFISPLKGITLYNAALFWGLGAGFVSLEMFLLSILGFRFNLFTVCLPWFILFLFAVYRRLKSPAQFRLGGRRAHFSAFQYFVIFLIMIIVLINFMTIFLRPLAGWDALVMWNHKAKVFYIDKSIDFSLFADKLSIFANRTYPLALPLVQTLFYIFLGSFDDQLVKLIFFFLFLCILITLYNLIKALADKTIALLGVFFFSTIPMVYRHVSGVRAGYADLIYSYFGFISACYLILWLINQKEKRFLYISCIFSGLAFWTKLEGAILIAANLITIFYYNIFFKKSSGCVSYCFMG